MSFFIWSLRPPIYGDARQVTVALFATTLAHGMRNQAFANPSVRVLSGVPAESCHDVRQFFQRCRCGREVVHPPLMISFDGFESEVSLNLSKPCAGVCEVFRRQGQTEQGRSWSQEVESPHTGREESPRARSSEGLR